MLESVEHDEELLAAIGRQDPAAAGRTIRQFLIQYYSSAVDDVELVDL